jgi:hypothetical protein
VLQIQGGAKARVYHSGDVSLTAPDGMLVRLERFVLLVYGSDAEADRGRVVFV